MEEAHKQLRYLCYDKHFGNLHFSTTKLDLEEHRNRDDPGNTPVSPDPNYTDWPQICLSEDRD
jgi:hypothetical protein